MPKAQKNPKEVMCEMTEEKFGPHGPYAEAYRHFFNNSPKHKGYDFGETLVFNIPPPIVTFSKPLRWWALDRPKRLKIIREARDQWVNEILTLGSFVKKSGLKALGKFAKLEPKFDPGGRVTKLSNSHLL